jgi:hypothetical protein
MVSSTFRSHLGRSLFIKEVSQLKAVHVQIRQPIIDNIEVIASRLNAENGSTNTPGEVEQEFAGCGPESISGEEFEKSIVHSIAALCLTMQVVCNIPVASIDEILRSLNMISSYSSSHLSHKIKSA